MGIALNVMNCSAPYNIFTRKSLHSMSSRLQWFLKNQINHVDHIMLNQAAFATSFIFLALNSWAGTLPNHALTPGVVDPHVTQSNLYQTVCVRGYSSHVRPPESYTEPLKYRLIALYGDKGHRVSDYELDHLIEISTGGSPADPANLWLQPRWTHWNARKKDELEFRLHQLLCHGDISLGQAQQAQSQNWIESYRKYVHPDPTQDND